MENTVCQFIINLKEYFTISCTNVIVSYFLLAAVFSQVYKRQKHLCRQADIWGCGVVFALLLTGVRKLWNLPTKKCPLFKMMNENVNCDRWPEDEEAKIIIFQMLSHYPSNRPTATKVLKMLPSSPVVPLHVWIILVFTWFLSL